MFDFHPHLDWIDTQSDGMRQRVIEWAGINSGTFNLPGLARMNASLRSDFAALGGAIAEIPLQPAPAIDAQGHPVQRPLGNALRILLRPDAPLRVFLCIHMDTVYAADHPFQTATQLDANTLGGPGVADAKGGIAVMLTALQAFERSPWASRIGWEVLLNPDEEIGSPGSAPLLVEAAQRNHVGLLFEPATPDGSLVGRRKGTGNFTIVVRGRSAHAGRDFALGRSAVLALAELVVRLHALNDALPGITVNVGRIEGGGAVNVVPDLAIARVNVRISDPADEPRLRERFDQLIAGANAQDGITAELHGGITSPPKLLDPRTQALLATVSDTARLLGLDLGWRDSGGACDGNKLAAAGLPNVDTLGPRGGDIHSPSEFLLLDSLPERAKLCTLLLMRLACGDYNEMQNAK